MSFFLNHPCGLLLRRNSLNLCRFEILLGRVLHLISANLPGLLLPGRFECSHTLLQMLDGSSLRIDLEGYGLGTCVIVLQGNLNGVLSNVLSSLSV